MRNVPLVHSKTWLVVQLGNVLEHLEGDLLEEVRHWGLALRFYRSCPSGFPSLLLPLPPFHPLSFPSCLPPTSPSLPPPLRWEAISSCHIRSLLSSSSRWWTAPLSSCKLEYTLSTFSWFGQRYLSQPQKVTNAQEFLLSLNGHLSGLPHPFPWLSHIMDVYGRHMPLPRPQENGYCVATLCQTERLLPIPTFTESFQRKLTESVALICDTVCWYLQSSGISLETL